MNSAARVTFTRCSKSDSAGHTRECTLMRASVWLLIVREVFILAGIFIRQKYQKRQTEQDGCDCTHQVEESHHVRDSRATE